MRSKIFSTLPDNNTCKQPCNHRKRKTKPVFESEQIQYEHCARRNENSTRIDSSIKGRHERFDRCVFFCSDQKNSKDRKKDTYRSNNHGCKHRIRLHLRIGNKSRCTKCGSGENRTTVRFIKIGAHPGDVTYIISHIIGNGSRIAWIIFRYPCFNFSHQISSDVGRFGVYSPANACK